MRTTFVNVLLEEAKKNGNIELLTGDLGFGVLKYFIEQLPSRFTNCGIAEQNMLSMAGGLSSMGKCVVVYSIGNFPTLRALEQIRNDICYYNHNVKIVCIGGGYTYGSLGMSHHATEDIAVMRSLPNMTIFTPSDKIEAEICARAMLNIKGPCYLRLERDSAVSYHDLENILDIRSLQPVVSNNSKFAVICYGTILEEAINYCKKNNIDLFTAPCLKPINHDSFKNIVSKYEKVFSLEEHSVFGGLGDLLCSLVAQDSTIKTKIIKIGIMDTFLSDVGDQKYMRKCAGIDGKTLEKIIINEMNK